MGNPTGLPHCLGRSHQPVEHQEFHGFQAICTWKGLAPGKKKTQGCQTHALWHLTTLGHLEQDKVTMGTPVLVVLTRVGGEIWIGVHGSPVDQMFGRRYP